MANLFIYIDSYNVLLITIFFTFIVYLIYHFLNRGFYYTDYYQADDNNNQDKISFVITNRTDSEIFVDLCNLNEKDNSYSFYTSPNNYDKLIEYLKNHIVYVYQTVLEYSDNDYIKKFVYKTKYNINKTDKEPIISSLDEIDLYQYDSHIINSKKSYIFNYFNSLELKLSPNEKVSVNLYFDQYDKGLNTQPIKHLISLKNNSNKTKVVELFNKEYYQDANNKDVEIKSIFGDTHYKDILDYHEIMPIVFSKLKMHFSDENVDSEIIINKKSYTIVDFYQSTQLQSNIIEHEFKNVNYINNFSVELKPNSEIIICLK